MPLQSWNLLSQHQVWVSASSLSGDSLALAFLPGQGGPSQGRGHPPGEGSAGSPQPGWEWHQRAFDIVLSGHQSA